MPSCLSRCRSIGSSSKLVLVDYMERLHVSALLAQSRRAVCWEDFFELADNDEREDPTRLSAVVISPPFQLPGRMSFSSNSARSGNPG